MSAALVGGVVLGTGLVAYAYRQFCPTLVDDDRVARVPKHWSEAQPDRTGQLFRASALLIGLYCIAETAGICARGIATEGMQRSAAIQAALLACNAYALWECKVALRLRQRYFDTEKDPPPGWPPVKSAIVWRVLAADSIVLAALLIVDSLQGNWLSSTWRAILLLCKYWLVTSNPLPFYTA